jgi:hypothetical protein
MKLYAVYHRPTNTFPSGGNSAGVFSPLSRWTLKFNGIGPAKAFITRSFKVAKRCGPEFMDFLLGLEIIEMDILFNPVNINKPVYLATFSLDKI